MAYTKTEWKDQVVENPRTYVLRDNGNGTTTLLDSFGDVTEIGTPVNAENMNHIENGIASVESSLQTQINQKANTSAVVTLTGTQAITGEKTLNSTLISRNALALACDDPNITKGTAPSTSKNTLIRFRDTNGANVGVLYHSYGTDKTSVVSMQAIKSNASSDTDYANVSVYYPASGNPYATAPASDVNNSIVTTVNKSKATNGYFKLGNGLIIQWGTVSGTGGTITLPTPFSNANYGVTFTRKAASGTNDNDAITARRATSFDVTIYGSGGGNWIAIGY